MTLRGDWAVWAAETPAQRWQRKVNSISTLEEAESWRQWPLPPEVEVMLLAVEERLLRDRIDQIRKQKGLKRRPALSAPS